MDASHRSSKSTCRGNACTFDHFHRRRTRCAAACSSVLLATRAMKIHVRREERIMPDITAQTWFPVLTLLVGYATKSLSDWIQNKRSIAREREGREAARQDQRVAQRITFQRETLLELQEATMQLGRTTSRSHHLDEMAFRESNNWRKNFLPDDLDEGHRQAQAR